jgi:hypothetical protein
MKNIYIREILNMEKSMVKENINIFTIEYMKVNLKAIKGKDLVSANGF